MSEPSFISELLKRKVVQTATIYGAVAWSVTEIIVTVSEQLQLPDWIATLAVIGFVVGFPVAMFLSWTFDLTPEGIRRTEFRSHRGKASIFLSMLLLFAGTAALFLVINPSLDDEVELNPVPAAVTPDSVAVMPFEHSGFEPEDEWLSQSLSDEIRDELAQVGGIRVAARSSSHAARSQALDAIEISQKLAVTNLVEGVVRRQEDLLKVSVHLIEGSSGLSLWSGTFERPLGDLLDLELEIADQLVELMVPDAPPREPRRTTHNATANELLLLARHYDQQVRDRRIVDEPLMRKAINLYREAIEADPVSAIANARLAGALVYLGELNAAEPAVFRALSLNPNLSEVQNTLGEFYYARGLPEARVAFGRAVELNPNNADALHNLVGSLAVEPTINVDLLADLLRRALELDRLSLSRYAALAQFLASAGEYEQVPPLISEIRNLFDTPESYRVIDRLSEMIGEVDKAIAWTLRARDFEPENPDHKMRLAELYALIGEFETARQLAPEPTIGLLFALGQYEQLIDEAELLMIDNPSDMDVRHFLAFAHNTQGSYDSAIYVLSSTGLPDSVLERAVRSPREVEAFITLINALAGLGQPSTIEMAHSLATFMVEGPWWGDTYWIGTLMSCCLSTLERDEEALQALSLIKDSKRIVWDGILLDAPCMRRLNQQPIYKDVLKHNANRKAEIREKLPATLREFGVEL